MVKLHKRLKRERANSRVNCGDEGKMYSLGRKSNGEEFVISKNNQDIQKMIFKIGKMRKKWVQKELPNEYENHFKDNIDLSYMSESISDFMVHSEALANASHYDINDSAITISTWIEESIGNTKNWFLVFPNLTTQFRSANDLDDFMNSDLGTNNNNIPATAIELSQGTTVVWDASRLRHASTRVIYQREESGTSGGNCETKK